MDMITHLVSEEKEELKLANEITTKAQIDKWLGDIEKQMMETLKVKMFECLKLYEDKVELSQEMTRSEWMLSFNSQLIVTITQLLWTRECEKAIIDKDCRKALKEYSDVIEENMSE
mmetsp:Transcript_83293/g.179702  ORF Transcript_83293/g.179702 Transcript_83293/m.179702 type:complete len:116 (-) Transcript_83293:33-380(-)